MSSLTVTDDNRVWVPDAAEVWRLAHVVERDEAMKLVTVEPVDGGALVTLPSGECHRFDPSHETDLDDASLLNNLHEAPLLNLICSRFKKDKIYTNVGGVLISVNPYKVIPKLYTLMAPQANKGSGAKARAASAHPEHELTADEETVATAEGGPHVYLIALQALEAVESSKEYGEAMNQSVVISGESGAGKTEASKHVMRYLIHQSLKRDLERQRAEAQAKKEARAEAKAAKGDKGGGGAGGARAVRRSSLAPEVFEGFGEGGEGVCGEGTNPMGRNPMSRKAGATVEDLEDALEAAAKREAVGRRRRSSIATVTADMATTLADLARDSGENAAEAFLSGPGTGSPGRRQMPQTLPLTRATSRTITSQDSGGFGLDGFGLRGDTLAMFAVERDRASKEASSSDIESKLMQSNVILEAFGNAKTVRNDNSSRFGKYIKLQYNASGRMVQAKTMHFLLEKSRLVTVAPKERNYHVFYMLCAGLEDTPLAQELNLKPAKSYKLCSMGGCLSVDAVNDGKDFGALQVSLKECGVSDDELEAIAKLVAALLQLGEVHGAPMVDAGGKQAQAPSRAQAPAAGPCSNYRVDLSGASMGVCKCGHPKPAHSAATQLAKGGEMGITGERCLVLGQGATPESQSEAVGLVAALLGVSEEVFQRACTVHEIETAAPGSGGKVVKTEILLSETQATENVMALIKFVYSGLFGWLVDKINVGHRASNAADELPSFIGILDIFGFEIMAVNSFEQLCINYANEVLQQQFNQTIFVQEQAMYIEEGLDWSQISFRDNQGIIDLLGKKPRGLLVVCEEHVKFSFVKAIKNNTALLQQMDKTHVGPGAEGNEDSTFYTKGRFNQATEFIIKHFAGDVTYTITGFIEKNTDSLNEELRGLLTSSTEPFLVTLFGEDADAKRPDMPGYLPPPPEPTAAEAEALAAAASAAAAAPALSPAPGHGNRGSIMSVGRANRGSVLMGAGMAGGMAGGMAESKHKSAGANSVSLRFRQQLDDLTATLRATTPHYIKCIKPNGVKAAGAVSQMLVVQQLRYSGVLEVVRIRREAYPTRLAFGALHKAFGRLLSAAFGWKDKGPTLSFNPRLVAPADASEAQSREACHDLCLRFLDASRYQLGKTKVFLRNQVLELLKGCEDHFFASKAGRIQAAVRMVQARRRYQRSKRAAALLQRCGRTVGPRRNLKRAKTKAAKIQALARGRIAARKWIKHKAAKVLQALARGRRHRQRHVKAKAASILMGKLMRGKLVRMHYGKQAVLRKAAVRMQALMRGRVYKAKGQARLLAARHGANMIAAMMRRKQAERMLAKSKRAAVALQCGARSRQSKSLVGVKRRQKLENDTATFVQAQVRAIAARKKFSSLKTLDRLRREKEAKKATRLQAAWMGHKARNHLKANKKAQTLIAGVVRRRQAVKGLAKAKASAVLLQSKGRAMTERKRYKRYRAAEAIQARARARLCRKAFVAKRAQAVVVQSLGRRFLALAKRARRKKGAVRVARAVMAWRANALLDVCLDRAHRRCLAGDLAGLMRVLDFDAQPLRDQGVDLRVVRHRRQRFRHLIHAAALGGSLPLVAELGPTRSELRSIDGDGNTALHHAAATLNLELIKLLVATLAPDSVVSAEDVNKGNLAPASADGTSALERATLRVKGVTGMVKRGTDLSAAKRRSVLLAPGVSLALHDPRAAGAHPAAGAMLADHKATKGGQGMTLQQAAAAGSTDTCEVKCGFLRKRRETDTFRKRWCVLRSDATGLSYYDTKTSKDATRIPLGGALLKRCTLKDAQHKFAFEIHSPQLMGGKNKEGRLYFGCDSEMELNEWFTDLRKVCGSTQVERANRAEPMSFANVARRATCLSKLNKAGETTLHCAAHLGRRAGLDPKMISAAASLAVLAWLVENGVDPNGADAKGRTALHQLVEARAVGMPAAMMLTRLKGANMSVAAADGRSALDLCLADQVEPLVMRGSLKQGLLPPPAPKVENCCYASLLFEKSSMASTDRFKRPSLTCTLMKLGGLGGEDHATEEPQSVPEPCVTRPDYFWWGAMVHLQTPLENLGAGGETGRLHSGAAVLVELKDDADGDSKSGAGGPSEKAGGWALLDVSKQTIDTKDVQLELFSFPVDLKRRTLRGADIFLSARVILTRAGEDPSDVVGDEEEGEGTVAPLKDLKDLYASKKAERTRGFTVVERPRDVEPNIPASPAPARRQSAILKAPPPAPGVTSTLGVGAGASAAAPAAPAEGKQSLVDKLNALTSKLSAGEVTKEAFDAAKKDILAGK